MKKIKYFIFFISLFFITSITSVFATSNWNTYFEMNIPNFNTYLSNFHFSDNVSLYDYFVDMFNLIDNETSSLSTGYYVSAKVNTSNNKMYIEFIPKIYNDYNTSLYFFNGSSSSTYNRRLLYGNTQLGSYYIPYYSVSLQDFNFTSTSFGLDTLILNTAKNGGSCTSLSGTSCSSPTYYNNFDISCNNSATITNNNNYQCNTDSWLFYDNSNSVLSNYNASDSNSFVKSLKFPNNEVVNYNEKILSYSDINNLIIDNEINISGTLKNDDIFISNVPLNNLSNLKVNFSYNYFDNPSDLTNFQQFFIGRINQGTYYSYEDINCFGSLSFATDTINKKINSTLKNISCTSSLTNYDEIFIRLRPTQGHGQNIKDLSLKSNYGYINRSPFYNGNNNYQLMEYFYQLSSDFNILLSTASDIQYSSFISDTKYSMMTSISKNNNSISGLSSNPSDYGSYNNTNLMIYNYLPSNNQNTNLYLFFDTESILSLSSNSGTFTYYNNNNNIVSNTIINGYQIDSSSYDLDSVFDKVNNFIDDLQDDMSEVHNLLQASFDSLSPSIKLIIIIIYILTLSFLLFKIIRR